MVELPLGTHDMGEGAETGGSVGVVRAQARLADGEGLPVQLAGLWIVGPLKQVPSSPVQQPGRRLRVNAKRRRVAGHSQGVRQQPRLCWPAAGSNSWVEEAARTRCNAMLAQSRCWSGSSRSRTTAWTSRCMLRLSVAVLTSE